MKTTMYKLKNTLDGISCRLDIAAEKTSEHEDIKKRNYPK